MDDEEVNQLNIVIPFEGRARTILRSSFLIAHRQTETEYSLSGEALQMTGVTAGQLLILPDDVPISEGALVTEEIRMRALPIESFITVSAEETLADALGLVLRTAVADGRITDAELLRVAPALEGRQWQPDIEVAVGDVYAFGIFLWRCIQAHTTQENWPPDLTPALWRKVEIVPEHGVRVWQAGMDYTVGDVLAYPDADSPQYECRQAHTSQEGWEPPNTPALWVLKT